MFDYDCGPCLPRGMPSCTAWSNFSFLEGASHPEELIERGRDVGLGRARADRSRRALRLRPLCQSRQATPTCRRSVGAELTLDVPELRPKRRSAPARRAESRRLSAPRSAGRKRARLRQPVRADLDSRNCAGRKRDARSAARRLRRPHRRAHRALRLRATVYAEKALRAATTRRARTRSRALARSLSRPLLSRTAAPLAPRRRRARAAQLVALARTISTCRTSQPTASLTPTAKTRGSATSSPA